MTTGERVIGRGLAVLGIGFGVAYLTWRVSSSLGRAPWWLAAAMLAVEVVGLVAFVALVYALWAAPDLPAPTSRPLVQSGRDRPAVEVIIRSDGQGVEAVRATLLAARSIGSLHVVDLRARPEVASVALSAGARYSATDFDDRVGLARSLEVAMTDTVLLLDAGDIARPDILDILNPFMADQSVAIVQGAVTASSRESAEHDAGGRHVNDFERRALWPSLGARGVGAFTGSGALVRRAALVDLDVGHLSATMTQACVTSALFASGWKIVAPGGAAVAAVPAEMQADAVEARHSAEASAARYLLRGPNGAMRSTTLSMSQRVALTAMAVRPLSGVRRSVFIAVLLATLLAGSLPFSVSWFGLTALWAPWFVLSSASLWFLSAGTLRPGDRLRHSMRLLGASWRGSVTLEGPNDDTQHSVSSAFGIHHGVAPAIAVAAISVIIGLRGISDRVTHTLEPLSADITAGLLVVALWSLGGGLDALRLLARRSQGRRATRVASSLPATFAGRGALVVDLTPLGAGVIGDLELAVGSHSALDVVVPTPSGCVSATIDVVVRNCRLDFSGEQRFGIEFGPVEAHVVDALTEYSVVQPALQLLGAGAGAGASSVSVPVSNTSTLVVIDDQPLAPRRIGLRAAAMVAVAGALASAVPSSAEASGSPVRLLRGEVVATDVSTDSQVPTSDSISATVGDTAPATSVADAGSAATTTARPVDTVDIVVVVDSIAAVGPPAVPAGAGADGAMVSVVCSTDAGADGAYGTADDVYGSPLTSRVGADGSYELELEGEACWLSVAPPVGYMVQGDSTSLETALSPRVVDLSTASPAPVRLAATTAVEVVQGTASLDDVVWADLDSDGAFDADERLLADVTVTLYDSVGSAIGSQLTAFGGRFNFENLADGEYSLGVSNLPAGLVPTGVTGRTGALDVKSDGDVNAAIGLRPVRATPVVSVPTVIDDAQRLAPERLLAEPRPIDLAPSQPSSSPIAVLLVVFLATLIGLSVLAGTVRPRRSSTAT